jgi:hypothetical protein
MKNESLKQVQNEHYKTQQKTANRVCWQMLEIQSS